jgi:hypothetical protein
MYVPDILMVIQLTHVSILIAKFSDGTECHRRCPSHAVNNQLQRLEHSETDSLTDILIFSHQNISGNKLSAGRLDVGSTITFSFKNQHRKTVPFLKTDIFS